MREQLLLSVSIMLAVSIFSIPSAWAEDQHCCQAAVQGEHQCVQSEGLDKALDSYFAILASLSQDSMENVRENAKHLAECTGKLAAQCVDSKDGEKVCRISPLVHVSAAAQSLADANDIGAARSDFGVISEKLVEHLKGVSEKESRKLYVFRCDKAQKVWLQRDEEPGNPYFGVSMAKCRRKID